MQTGKKSVFIVVAAALVLSGLFAFGAQSQAFHTLSELAVTSGEETTLGTAALIENRGFSLALVVLAGIIDGTNVCGIALMMLLVGYLLVFVKDRRRAMLIGVVFLTTIFVCYFLMGAFLSAFVQSVFDWPYYREFSLYLNYLLVFILAVAGLLNIQDFFFSKKIIFDLGSNQRQAFRAYLRKIDIGGTVGLGILAVLFLLPCSVPIYLTSVGVLAQTFSYSKVLLFILVYCLFFILPLLIIMAVLLRAQKHITDHDVRSERFKWLILVKGAIQILAAIGLSII